MHELPLKYELTEAQLTDWAELKEIFAMLGHKTKYNLDEGAINSLLLIADKSSGYATIMAQNILSLYGRHFQPYYYISDPVGEQRIVLAPEKEDQPEVYIKAYPVPASNFVVLEWNGLPEKPPASIRIKNLAGQTVWAHLIISQEGKVQWEGNSGIYFFGLVQAGKEVQSGKIVIIKN